MLILPTESTEPSYQSIEMVPEKWKTHWAFLSLLQKNEIVTLCRFSNEKIVQYKELRFHRFVGCLFLFLFSPFNCHDEHNVCVCFSMPEFYFSWHSQSYQHTMLHIQQTHFITRITCVTHTHHFVAVIAPAASAAVNCSITFAMPMVCMCVYGLVKA